jgi:CubicO group peptidase (beta-lactamase class C family)
MMQLVMFLLVVAVGSVESVADDLQFPDQDWAEANPQQVSIDPLKVQTLFDMAFADQATQGVVLIKDGLLIGERYAQGFDSHSPATSWSMAKSFYAAVVGTAIDRGEIGGLDDKVSKYLSYFGDDRGDITLRHLLNMTSGLEMPSHEHEHMFFTEDHLAYAKAVGVEKSPGQLFEYNNVNSMLLSDILFQATGAPADALLRDRILAKIGMTNVNLWQDAVGNPLTYCCIDTTARQYARFGLLFARGGLWRDQQLISKSFIDETFGKVWDSLESKTIQQKRGYSLHWWISRYDEEAKIFNASGKFGQYIFVDPANDMVFVRVTKYHPTGGSKQDWGPLKFINKLGSVEFRRKLAIFLNAIGLIEIEGNIKSPMTFDDGVSNEFFRNYRKIMDAMVALNQS